MSPRSRILTPPVDGQQAQRSENQQRPFWLAIGVRVANQNAVYYHGKDYRSNSTDLISWGEDGAVKVYNVVTFVLKIKLQLPARRCRTQTLIFTG